MANSIAQKLQTLSEERKGHILAEFQKKKECMSSRDPGVSSREFTAHHVFSAKLFIFLYRELSICKDLEISDDEDLYPEYSEDIGRDILRVFHAKGSDFFKAINEEALLEFRPIFWKDPRSFKNFARQSIGIYNIGQNDPQQIICSLQQMAAYLLVMCLYGGQVNQSCFAYAPACWAELFYDIYSIAFSKIVKWDFWKTSKEVRLARIPDDLKELSYSKIQDNAQVTYVKIWSVSNLEEHMKRFNSMINETQKDDMLEYIKVIYLTLVNAKKNEESSNVAVPFRSYCLWSPYGSEYINLHIFAQTLMKCLFKKCGLSAELESRFAPGETEDLLNTSKSLSDAVESVAKATILMLLYRRNNREVLTYIQNHCRTFEYDETMKNYLWLYIIDALDLCCIPTIIACLKVLQMTGCVLEMAAADLTPQLYNFAYKIWVKVFMLLYGRDYASRGGWMIFVRDSYPTIRVYALESQRVDESILNFVKDDKWPEITSFFLQKHGALKIRSQIQESDQEMELDSNENSSEPSPGNQGSNEENLSRDPGSIEDPQGIEAIEMSPESQGSNEAQSEQSSENQSSNAESQQSFPTTEEQDLNKEPQSGVLAQQEQIPQATEDSEFGENSRTSDSDARQVSASEDSLDEHGLGTDGASPPKKPKVQSKSAEFPECSVELEHMSTDEFEEARVKFLAENQSSSKGSVLPKESQKSGTSVRPKKLREKQRSNKDQDFKVPNPPKMASQKDSSVKRDKETKDSKVHSMSTRTTPKKP